MKIIFNFSLKTILLLYFILLFVTLPFRIKAQCTNTVQFPATTLLAPTFNEPLQLTANSNAGQFIKLQSLVLGKTYLFSSGNPADFITIRDKDGLTLLASGPTPLSYQVGTGPDIITIHINLQSPACGVSAVDRAVSVQCLDCVATPVKMGIGTNNPEAILDVNGEIKINKSNQDPKAGMIRWNDNTQDFEGFNGAQWLSLTKPTGKWGQIPLSANNEKAKITAIDGAADERFGYQVSISGDYAIVSAPNQDIGANADQGAAYIFFLSDHKWVQQAKLLATDGAASDFFGASVSISGDYAIVGAHSVNVGNKADQGAAYIFVRTGTTWTQQAKLLAQDGAANDKFGVSVSITDDYAIVGAYADAIGANTEQGSAYIFSRVVNSWTQQAKLVASDGAGSDRFGYSVAISGDYAIVGAYLDDVGAYADQGSAYIFSRSGTSWPQQAKILAGSSAVANERFGISVSISGDRAMVGAYYFDVNSNVNQGAAFIYKRYGTTWPIEKGFTAGSAADYFGYSVCISGERAIVGAYSYDVGSSADQGIAYLYGITNNIWEPQGTLLASDGAATDRFGWNVAIGGNNAMVGAYVDDIDNKVDQGSVYVFMQNQ